MEGIGLAVTNFLLQSAPNNRLVLVARSKSALEDIKAKHPERVEILPADLEDYNAGPKAVELAVSKFGQLDALVLNHGILGEVKRVADGDPAEWRRTFDVNFFSVFACVSIWQK